MNCELSSFDNYLDAFLENVKNVIACEKKELDKLKIDKHLENNISCELKKILGKVGLRCLLLEFQVFNKLNNIEEYDDKEKIKYYREMIWENKSYCQLIFNAYPEMKLIFKNMLESQIIFVTDIVEKFEKDKKDIYDNFFPGIKEMGIEGIHLGRGDLHYGGKGVIEICLKGGLSIFYKPRSVIREEIFMGFLNKIEGNSPNSIGQYQSIDRIQYGWTKKIQQKDCYLEEERKRFYERIGIIACISYIFGTHDLHYQNMIAHGEHPFLIDLENIFMTDESTFRIGESVSCFYTVLSSGLFPVAMKESCYCAVTGGNGGESLYQVPMLKVNKKSISITYAYSKLQKGKNLPGTDIKASDYWKEIKKGFNRAYRYINHMDEAELLLMIPKNLESRYLMHSTQLYYNILEASYHPALMRKVGDRKEFLQKICPVSKVKKYEVEDLINGDIPYFYRKANGRSLFTSSGEEIKDFFNETVFDAIQRRKRAMSEEDRELQCNLLKWSLKISDLGEGDFENSVYYETVKNDEKVEWAKLALRMAEKIKKETIWYNRRTKVTWIRFMYSSNKKMDVHLGICDFYLYEGLAGIFLFMKAMEVATKGYKKINDALEDELFEYTDSVLSGRKKTISNYTGIYCGEGSIVYTYMRLFQMTREEKYLVYAIKHAEIVKRLVAEDTSVDIIYGNAGAILVFCNLYKLTKSMKCLEYAIEAEKYLRKRLQVKGNEIFFCGKNLERSCVGIAHGNSGLVLAYGRLVQYVEDADYSKILKGLLMYENRLFLERFKGGEEMDEKISDLPSWCHGDNGILFVYLHLNMITNSKYDPQTKIVIEHSEKILKNVITRTSMSLCHGNLGNLLMMKKCVKMLQMDTQMLEQFEKKVGKIARSKRLLLPIEKLNYGYMQGIAGFGYACLQMSEQSELVKSDERGCIY